MRAYRIIEVKDGLPYTLYHGLNGSRRLPVGEWLEASRRMVKDGSRSRGYLSGFQVFLYRSVAELFMVKKFRKSRDLRVIEVEVGHELLFRKPTNPDVWLVDRIRISSGWAS